MIIKRIVGPPAGKSIRHAYNTLVLAFGSYIQQRRKQVGKTVQDIGVKIGTDHTIVNSVEHGVWNKPIILMNVLREAKVPNPNDFLEVLQQLENLGKKIEKITSRWTEE